MGQDLGFVQLIMVATIGLYLATLAASGSDIGMGGLGNLLAPSPEMLFRFGASGAIPVFRFDRWWTIFSAGWLHGGLLHIFFNVLWVRQLAPETAELYGPGRTVIIYTVSGAAGFALSSVMGLLLPGVPLAWRRPFHRRRVGADLRAARRARLLRPPHRQLAHRVHRLAVRHCPVRLRSVHERRRQPCPCRRIRRRVCRGVLLDPSKRERIDHLLGALACLVITAGGDCGLAHHQLRAAVTPVSHAAAQVPYDRRMDNPLKLRQIHHVEFWVGNAKQAAFYYRKAFGFSQFAYSGLETGSRDLRLLRDRAGQGPLRASPRRSRPDHPAADHLRLHGDGVRDIAFHVDDADARSRRRCGAAPSPRPSRTT